MIVPGQHHHLDAVILQRLDCVGRGLFDRIGNRNQPRKLPIHSGKNNCSATMTQLVGLIAVGGHINLQLLHQQRITECHLLPFNLTHHAFAVG